mmetsp:Transcript_85947/g.152267  ORF Transcript_85947/g.152267 Transcript_85947/m.152267 type:complete len:657 (-) Transcript_85947:175-2145(-)
MSKAEEARQLLSPKPGDAELGDPSWPVLQPEEPRSARYFLVGKTCGCCPLYFLLAVPLALLAYFFGFVALMLALVVMAIAFLCLACPLCYVYWFTWTWQCSVGWVSDIYVKIMYLAYQSILLSRSTPTCTPEYMPPSSIRPKEQLPKGNIAYALNIKVPNASAEEFTNNAISSSSLVETFEENLAKLPMTDRFEAFEEGEDPVAFVMEQLSSVFPSLYQVWDDKQSDTALVRFCLYGLGAHRLETEIVDGTQMYVVRTNQLADLSMREGFERYGGDFYFTKDGLPVKIVDKGLAPLKHDGTETFLTFKPGDSEWNRAKFRFRSSLSVLVTLVDHLYGVHLQTANLFTTAIREQLSADHPMRRFMTPFTYQTISVNSNARQNLVEKRSMGPRCFGLSDHGFDMAWAAAPSLLMSGLEVSAEDGGPILDRIAYYDYLKAKRGIDTEYYRQGKELCKIYQQFIEDYVACYYPSKEAFVSDPELQACMRQFFYQMEAVTPKHLNASGPHASANEGKSDTMLYKKMIDALTNFMFIVTAGHEQVGAVEVYVQDVSFCAFKWVPGAVIGTKQTATAQALLMSFTSTPMPKLMNEDWSFLFPKPTSSSGAKTPELAFKSFQAALQAMSKKCDAYNDAASSRSYPECFPMYVLNPKLLETSISV